MRAYRGDRRVENHSESDRHHVQIVQECLRKGEIDASQMLGEHRERFSWHRTGHDCVIPRIASEAKEGLERELTRSN